MQLVKLSCNKESFRTISFKSGLNLIVAKKSNPTDKNEKKTYNGVGKSLTVSLIHFCLASNTIQEFEDKIPGWEFSLKFEIDGTEYTSKRNTSNQKRISLNNEDLSLTKFREKLRDKLFNLKDEIRWLKFRPLVSRFIRPRKKSYMSFDCFENKESNIGQLMSNSYLLGLDVSLILKKYDLKQSLDQINTLKKNIEKDQIIKDYFFDKSDLDLGLIDLEEKISLVEKRKSDFKIAENYQEIKEKSDLLKYNINKTGNHIILLKNTIASIDKSISLKPDISRNKIVKFYEEAKLVLNDKIKKNLEDVEKFHNSLISGRQDRLLKEKNKLLDEVENLDLQRTKKNQELNKYLKILDTHGAIGELVALNNQLNDLKNQREKLTTYQNLIKQYQKQKTETEIRMKENTLKVNDYLQESKLLIDENIRIFRTFSKEFYENKPGGIQIINDEGENLNRFVIKASIEDDASDGINEVKIFCFDMMLLKSKHNHNMNFIFHDSRLFSNMEPRQRTTLFRSALKECKDSGIQYIASINEDMMEPIEAYCKENEYEEIINNIILELTDESPEKKLLGIQVDVKYDEDL